MGGFQLYEHPDQELLKREEGGDVHPSMNPGKFIRILEMDDVRNHKLQTIIPDTTEEDLKDKTKGNRIINAIVLLQTSWFVVQCIARGFQRLPLTELEIITLAYAMVNSFIYLLWWDKPRNVKRPVRVYESVETNYTPEEWESGFLGIIRKILAYILGAQDGFVRLSEERKVPKFWSCSYGDRDEDEIALSCSIIGLILLGVTLGGLHFIGWWREFSSYPEFILWRISCVALVAAPLFFTIIVGLFGLANIDSALLDVIVCVFLLLSACLYIVARVVTVVIAFTALRSLPSDALLLVDWTAFIPHF